MASEGEGRGTDGRWSFLVILIAISAAFALVLWPFLTAILWAVIAAILFTLGVLGIFINRKNIIVILMAIELILLAVNINLVAFSAALGDLVGQVFSMFVLTVAAGEAAIGLAILVIYFRGRGTIAVDDANRMKG